MNQESNPILAEADNLMSVFLIELSIAVGQFEAHDEISSTVQAFARQAVNVAENEIETRFSQVLQSLTSDEAIMAICRRYIGQAVYMVYAKERAQEEREALLLRTNAGDFERPIVDQAPYAGGDDAFNPELPVLRELTEQLYVALQTVFLYAEKRKFGWNPRYQLQGLAFFSYQLDNGYWVNCQSLDEAVEARKVQAEARREQRVVALRADRRNIENLFGRVANG